MSEAVWCPYEALTVMVEARHEGGSEVYIRLTDANVARTVELLEGMIVVDVDKDGCVIGLELLFAEDGK